MNYPRLTFENLAVASMMCFAPALAFVLLFLWLLAKPWKVVIQLNENCSIIGRDKVGDQNVSPPGA